MWNINRGSLCHLSGPLSVTLKGHCPCHIIIVYRPPPSRKNGFTEQDFLNEMENLLVELASAPGKVVILGDFNVHWNHPEKPGVRRFRQSVAAFRFQTACNS